MTQAFAEYSFFPPECALNLLYTFDATIHYSYLQFIWNKRG